jgi:hypothetical protein
METVNRRTVKELRDELAKFDDDALVDAYEGEVIGVSVRPVVNVPGEPWGFIHLNTSSRHPSELAETEVPESLARRHPMKKSGPKAS